MARTAAIVGGMYEANRVKWGSAKHTRVYFVMAALVLFDIRPGWKPRSSQGSYLENLYDAENYKIYYKCITYTSN